MFNIVITGGTGLVGKALTKYLLDKGYSITILTRTIPKIQQQIANIKYAPWDVTNQTIDVNAVCNADYIVHLAGANVAEKRWTKKRKKEIIDSRIKSSTLLVKTLQNNPHKLKAFISASAIGWYGVDVKGKIFVEDDPPAMGFLGETCNQWEESVKPIMALGIRTVCVRMGIVLSNDGGALPAFKKLLRFGIAPILGSGKQMISWIHIVDVVRLVAFVLEKESLQGCFNAVAPRPVDNKTLMLTLAKKLRGQFYIPIYVPSFLLKILLGEMSVEVLKSTTVSCEKIHQQGFVFQFPAIETTLHNLLNLND